MSLVDWIYPIICVGCRREGKYICGDCLKKLVVPEAICPMCCKPSLDGWTHPRCKQRQGMERLIVGLPYRGMVQQCLKNVKYKSAWEVIKFLYELCHFEDIGDGVITSVPMWGAKEKERGFNQARILAEMIGNNVDLLQRARETKPMFGLKKKERQENIEGAFAPSKKLLAKGQWHSRIILVDDVWTTGATMRECARALKMAGAKEIWGVALAG